MASRQLKAASHSGGGGGGGGGGTHSGSGQGGGATHGGRYGEAHIEGVKLVRLSAIYVSVSAVLMIAVSVAMFRLRRRSDNKKQVGVAASASWPLVVRGTWSLTIMLLAVLPATVFVMSAFFGCLLAAMEQWDAYLGIEYVLTNVLGLEAPLTSVLPQTVGGKVVDVFMSIWAMLVGTTIMGISAGLCLLRKVADLVPSSMAGFLRHLFIYVPFCLLMLAVITGGILALVEGWTFGQGFLYMSGAIAGLANPIVDVAPSTAPGAFTESFCTCIELCLGGAVIGVVGGHPVSTRFITLFEGEARTIMAGIALDNSEENNPKTLEGRPPAQVECSPTGSDMPVSADIGYFESDWWVHIGSKRIPAVNLQGDVTEKEIDCDVGENPLICDIGEEPVVRDIDEKPFICDMPFPIDLDVLEDGAIGHTNV